LWYKSTQALRDNIRVDNFFEKGGALFERVSRKFR